MTKEDVLQKVNDYCNEKSYTNETLTDDFKEKFSEFFSKKYPEDTEIDAEGVVDDMKFNINTAFSATSKGITHKQKAYDESLNEYKRQIEELKKGKSTEGKGEGFTLPDGIDEKLERLERFETEARKAEKFKEVLSLAKKGVKENLHKSLAEYANDFVVNLDETSEAQAKKLTSRFQEIFKDSIGDIKPFAPRQQQKRDEEVLATVQKIKI